MIPYEFSNYKELYDRKLVKLWLDISTYCNAGCPQCHRTNANGLGKIEWLPLVQWSFEQFKSAFPIRVLQKFKEIHICGTWGDPIMNKDIFEIVSYILQNTNGMHILINTNGSIRDEEWWWKFGVLVRNRTTVYWAVEGINPKQHEKYRKFTDLQKILNNMDSFSAAGGISEVFTVIFEHNEKDMYNIAELSKKHGARQIMFIRSNRFYDNNSFKYVDTDGTVDYFYKSKLPINKDFYYKSWDLYNEESMRIIYEESNQA